MCLHKPEKWMQPYKPKLNLLFANQDQVVALPKNATVLAGNNTIPIQMYRIQNNILGMQFHPEDILEYARICMYSRFKIPNHLIQQAEESFKLNVDSNIVFNWIVNFLLL